MPVAYELRCLILAVNLISYLSNLVKEFKLKNQNDDQVDRIYFKKLQKNS